jgi:AraC-like DNA-binding protein
MHVDMHMHRSAEILYVTSEKINLTIFGKPCELVTPGRAELIFPYQPHEYTRADKTIPEISELCGFRTERNFYRQFKDMTGMTTREYRKSDTFIADADIIIV